MRLDHVSFACGPAGLSACADEIGQALGMRPVTGGIHPRFGTRNAIFPLKNERYIEVVEVLDHPSADSAPFGQAVRARSELGGGWLGWVVSVADLALFEKRLGRDAVPGNRKFPDGRELQWRQIGVKGLIADPQVPFLLSWISPPDLHPSNAAPTDITLARLQIAGSPSRVTDWLGRDVRDALEDLDVDWVAPNGTPGVLSVTFETPRGTVTI
ncbi:VOC family protein [Tersicoccus sp. MR15.9]|uniref:VOC family protein n=1 Tax=Tersicoccus mangrovi TaxID=3121635 RepID=UPI002FE63DEF